jgi:hypothetical protein
LGDYYRPIVHGNPIEGPFRINDLEITPFHQIHGAKESLGFRFGP